MPGPNAINVTSIYPVVMGPVIESKVLHKNQFPTLSQDLVSHLENLSGLSATWGREPY